jgi:hypothetical protein
MFWTMVKALFIEENVAQKLAVLLGHPNLSLFVYCVAFLFFIEFISRLHCAALL